ncbi:MAG: hypothetical protein HKN15_13740 [Xanthomonadales bacterium]|nr:hypothetical protein [Xanthomonadales bacterium]
MSASMEEGPLREAAIFARAVENVFRKLIRLLLGRMTLARLQEMIRIVYIEEAEQKLQRERPDKKVSLTKLALLTGLDTRTLNKHRSGESPEDSLKKDSKFLREITPECSILDYWSSSSRFTNAATQKPLILKIKGNHPSFESLMSETLASRGITAKSLIERLVESKAVEMNSRNNTVRLLNSQFLPHGPSGDFGSLELGLAAVGNLVETVVHNLELSGVESKPFFQRSNWTHRLNKANLVKLRSDLTKLMTQAEIDSVDILSKYEEDKIAPNQQTVGMGMFYFEED